MLIEFRTENHRSIRDEQVLNMVADSHAEEKNGYSRKVNGYSEPLLPVVAIYGANASGKTNILNALAFMRGAVVYSQSLSLPDDGTFRDPFAWGGNDQPSLFEVTFLVESIRYEYGFLIDDNTVIEEWLYAWPNGKKQMWYERDGDDFKFGDHLKGENKLISEITRPSALYLSTSNQFKHPQLQKISQWFRALKFFNITTFPRSIVTYTDSLKVIGLFDDSQDVFDRSRFVALLKSADVGIEDVRLIKMESENTSSGFRTYFELKHKNKSNSGWLQLNQESQGTQKLFRMALPILEALETGKIIIIDELESSLHPALARQIVQLFNDPAHNPKHAQLIFTTHDTNLLGTIVGEPALQRDQVWLTEKDAEGATKLYPLTDFKPRTAENLERGYLQGRYGAIPFLGKFAETVQGTIDEQKTRTQAKTRQKKSVPKS